MVVFDHATLLSRDDQGRPPPVPGRADGHDGPAPRAGVRRTERRALPRDRRGRPRRLLGAGDRPGRRARPDRRFRLRYISPQIEEILGYPTARFYADVWNWLTIVHPDDLAIGEETSQRLIDGQPWDVDYRMIADDGRIVWMHLEGRTVERDDDGNPRRLQGILMDVTARKEREVRLSEEATQLRSLVESMPGVPWTYTVDDPADWRPIYIAPQVEQLIGYTVGGAHGRAPVLPAARASRRPREDPGAGGAQHPARRTVAGGVPDRDARRQAPVAAEQGEPRHGRSRTGRCSTGSGSTSRQSGSEPTWRSRSRTSDANADP